MPIQCQTAEGAGMTPAVQSSSPEATAVWRGDFQYCPTCAQFVWVVRRNAVGQYVCPVCGTLTEERELPF